ncbi:MAG: hypothetical protein U9R41_05120 [Candidatus Marinimicrobia bacterium]|nr:hypothetical protein [Candidatus Neomarinimicrobiota bacterium]
MEKKIDVDGNSDNNVFTTPNKSTEDIEIFLDKYFNPRIKTIAQNKSTEDVITKKPSKKFPYIPVFGSLIVILILFLLFLFLNKNENKPASPIPTKLSIVEKDTTNKDENTITKEKKKPIIEKKKEPAIKNTETTYKETLITHQIIKGNTLRSLAIKYYDNAQLWPNIYRKNIETVANPDIILSGKSIEVPKLEGTQNNLTKQDSFNIADGYYLLYISYKKSDKKKANEFLKIAKRFNTTIEKNKK